MNMHMIRPILSTAFALLALALFGVATAQEGAPPPTQSDRASADMVSADLHVTRVVLFTSGVGYFEHSGTVTDSQMLELSVGTNDMDDLLQSLVLQDLDGGSIRPVRYPSRDPLGRILQGYSLDLSGDPTLASLLAQARGEQVTVQAATELDGTIVNVEEIETEVQGRQIFLTLATAEGLMRISFDEIRQIRFQDETLQQELDAALAALADFRGEDIRSVRLDFQGTGERRVRIGYVREMPVWKTSYRLVLDQDGSADLQGWAIFDNPTDMELRDIELSFVAGQPISFITGLYQPVYVERPRVEVSTAPSLVPPQYEAEFAPADARSEMGAAAPSAAQADVAGLAAPMLREAGVSSLAQGARTGATFTYRVTTPVTVGRHESAMVPIVEQTVAAQRLSVFDRDILAERPLRGVRLVNDTGLHLAAGPITVFDDGGFAGNARIADLLPGESRMLTFAVDLELSVATTSATEPERVTAVRIENGTIRTENRQRVQTTYRVDSATGDARFLVIEHPKQNGFEVVSPEPVPAQTPQSYRFGLVTGAGTTATGEADPTASTETAGDPEIPVQVTCVIGEACVLEVVMERVESRSIAVGNVTPDQIAFYLENVELSEADREVFDQILVLKRQLVTLDRQIADRRGRLEEIEREQARIRQNMGALDRNSSLYRRYVSDLEAQEDEIDAIQSELQTLQAQRSDLQERLDALIQELMTES